MRAFFSREPKSMAKDKDRVAQNENESSARDSNVIDAWFRLQKANPMAQLVRTGHSPFVP